MRSLILIGLNEFFSGFANIGHNDAATLIVLWIIPKWVLSVAVVKGFANLDCSGLWLVFPTYSIYTMGAEILNSLEQSTPRGKPGRPKSS